MMLTIASDGSSIEHESVKGGVVFFIDGSTFVWVVVMVA
jgi:hypothetical protein